MKAPLPYGIPPEFASDFSISQRGSRAPLYSLSGMGDVVSVPQPDQGPLTPDMAKIWPPQPILPDSVLPDALKRVKPGNRPFFSPNGNDQAMLQQAAIWTYVAQNGGPDQCCRIPELQTPVYNQDPRIVMPSGSQRYEKTFPLAAANISGGGPGFGGGDTVLGNFQVEIGWDGVINRVVFSCNDPSFTDFSGYVTWRLKIGQRYAKDLGNVQNSYGSYATAFLVPGSYIPLISGQTVQLIANIAANAPINNASKITAGVFGWFYSRR